MKNFKLLISSILILLSTTVQSQDCSIGNVSYCYGNNENTVLTYCPDDPVTQTIVVKLNDYDFENGIDGIIIYDGSGTGGTELAQITGAGNSGFSYIGTRQSDGGDGCVTLNIVSNGSLSCATGSFGPTDWDVFCQTQCTPPVAALTADVTAFCSTEAINQTTAVTVNFDASTSTHGNGTSFNTYEWDFGDGTTEVTNTPTTSHTYANAGGYIASVVVTDDLACSSTNLADQLIQVSGAPTFNLSSDAPPGGVCEGTTFNLSGSQTPFSWTEPAQQPTAPPTELPDGTGQTFESSVVFNQFGNGDVIQDGANLTLTINMEHSYMGDLLMELVCPNGTRITLLSFMNNNMGNTNTGGATTSTGPPGLGQDYTFSMSAATLFNTATYDGQNMPSGSYRPDETFANLNGCPLNGKWTIEITDNFNQDDGTLFSWTLTLGAVDENKRSLESFSNTYPTTTWSGNGVSGTTATPDTDGTLPYTYTATDDFGCDYSGTLNVTVLASNDPACNSAPVITSASTTTFAENSTVVVIDVQSTDDSDSEGNGLVYSLTNNGADDALFSIDVSSGEIIFNSPPNYEMSQAANLDNIYEIEVQVCDVENACTTQAITITVTDVDEDGDGYINEAEPDDADPCNPDPEEGACQQNCDASGAVISKGNE